MLLLPMLMLTIVTGKEYAGCWTCGRKITEGTLTFDWESEGNMDAFRERVAGLLKRCG